MKTTLKFVSLAVAATAALLTTSCSKQNSSDSASGAAAKPRVALVMKSLANEFFGTMAAGAKAHQAAKASTYDLISNGIKNETDLAEQGRARGANGRDARRRDRDRAG
ncbi:MAG: hypothetical protein NVV74_10185 [Magnetospirillum sp.]|nr:hypothetical protein [Magnetospirillum sp.]